MRIDELLRKTVNELCLSLHATSGRSGHDKGNKGKKIRYYETLNKKEIWYYWHSAITINKLLLLFTIKIHSPSFLTVHKSGKRRQLPPITTEFVTRVNMNNDRAFKGKECIFIGLECRHFVKWKAINEFSLWQRAQCRGGFQKQTQCEQITHCLAGPVTTTKFTFTCSLQSKTPGGWQPRAGCV